MTEPLQLLEDLRRVERRCHTMSVRKLMIVTLLSAVRTPMHIRAIQKATGMPKPAVTRNVDEMARQGFVTKARSVKAGEGRDCRVTITEKGLDLLGLASAAEPTLAKPPERV